MRRTTKFLLQLALVAPLCGAARAQFPPPSVKECRAQTAPDWGAFGSLRWHENEATFWSCRLRLAREKVVGWQKAIDLQGEMQDVQIVKLGNAQLGEAKLALVTEVSQGPHCFNFYALREDEGRWSKAWGFPLNGSDSGMEFCTFGCPKIQVVLRGNELVLRIPFDRKLGHDPAAACKDPEYRDEVFLWDGKTFALPT